MKEKKIIKLKQKFVIIVKRFLEQQKNYNIAPSRYRKRGLSRLSGL